jgi:hypothetical protein
MAHALHERNTAARTRAPVAAVGNLDAAALHEHREPVTLAAYNLGDPEVEVDVERERDRDIASKGRRYSDGGVAPSRHATQPLVP